jgi:endonuclease/exonuclease/phosphatase family metal-dependent hydrolase
MRTFPLFILAALLAGCTPRTVPPAPTGSSATAPETFDGTLRVLSYNIHHAGPPSKPGVIDMEAVARVIRTEDPYLVALQEVDVYTTRSGKTLHQAEELGRLTGMHAYFAKAIDFGGGEYGLALLSKYPLEDVQRVALPTVEGTGGEPRILLSGVATLPGGKKIRFAGTHLDAQASDTNRGPQMSRIMEVLGGDPLPVILAGDFNDGPSSRVIGTLDSRFRRTCTRACPPTFPVVTPKETIDYIAYKPAAAFAVQEHAVVDEHYASDHLPLRAVLKLQ